MLQIVTKRRYSRFKQTQTFAGSITTMCRGLDLLPDWDTPYIRDEFNCWCGVCTHNLTHMTSSSVSSQAKGWPVEFSSVVSCARSTHFSLGPGCLDGCIFCLKCFTICHYMSFKKIIFLSRLGGYQFEAFFPLFARCFSLSFSFIFILSPFLLFRILLLTLFLLLGVLNLLLVSITSRFLITLLTKKNF